MLSTTLESQSNLTHNVITTLARLGYFGFTIEGYLWGLHGWKNPWMKEIYIPSIYTLKKY